MWVCIYLYSYNRRLSFSVMCDLNLAAMLLGGIGGGLFGNHVRAAFGGMNQPDIDR